ncbi:hypothetical protein OOU_Y34scaffold01003g3 [Pyricularia oryzae Y34]|uniref:Uncharacterized protein n=2 Tax=Pyricularia oryzae TaxID=318829 RepID=A0AA97NMT2_PYRO3|nr:hypothetical protein OOU_Y34scaffold01003g3 [Pyricularia oryzae Y34]
MKFSILKGAVAALAVCSDVVLSQLTATQIVRNIEQLELISLDLKAPATFVDYLTQAQLITLGHSNFDVAKMTVDEMQGMETIPPGAEADAILDAFRDFAKAHTTYFLSMSKAPAGVRLLLAGIMPMDNLLKADESSIDASTGELKSYADNISGQRKIAIKAWDLNLAQKRSFGRAAFRQALRV